LNYKNRFVCPVPKWLRGELLEYNRLYAYPTTPEPLHDAEFQILDSGAYGLSKYQGVMSNDYIDKLAEHYLKYKTDDNIYCVAPDKSGDYKTTIKQFEYYLSKYEYNISPVLQFPNHGFDWFTLKKQIDYYESTLKEVPFIFFAKRGATATELQEADIIDKIQFIRKKLNTKWIHFFAAGWGKHEVFNFSKFDKNISIDTINYYQAAQTMQRNINDWGWGCGDKIKNSLFNVKLANKIMNI